ncbi:MAG TPA: helix-turn-helix transcriptional regulator [Acidimicrobiales bacterium]|nr:helix-turn-helix transcriptional regulator [Acidimicrobiales bacterium]
MSAQLTPPEIQRAGEVAHSRMLSLGLTTADLARAAHIDERTVRRLLAGTHFPTTRVCNALCEALDWPSGELWRQAKDGHAALRVIPTRALLNELVARARQEDDPDLAIYERLLASQRVKDITQRDTPSPSANSGQE